MRLGNSRRSRNIEDRRGTGFPLGRSGGIGLGGIVIVLVAVFFGVDPTLLLQGASQGVQYNAPGSGPATDQESDFVSRVLADTEDSWQAIFQAQGWGDYRQPVLVLYTGMTSTACGRGQAAMGPFYCPADSKVYLDLDFFRQMAQQLNSPGDFAQAYVIAHEVAHHVQHLRGVTSQVDTVRQRVGRSEANQLSVRLELQADCLAGVWAHHSNTERSTLEEGDIDEAINAAQAIGDDRLQHQAQGYVVPDSFTHGTSRQRATWLARGLETGDPAQCDTFSASTL